MGVSQIPNTIKELEQWLKNHCYHNLSYYSISGKSIYEGYSIDVVDGIYEWCFYDRSDREVLKQFKSEKDIVLYAHKEITSNSWTKNNIVGIFKSQEVNTILNSIKKRNINYTTDQLPYGKDDLRTRVFVTGCDINKVSDLIQETYKNS